MVAALLPVFVLIVLGVVLKRTLMRLERQWRGLERPSVAVLAHYASPEKQSGRAIAMTLVKIR